VADGKGRPGHVTLVFIYLLGRTDSKGRNVIDMWADKRSTSRLGSAVLSDSGVARGRVMPSKASASPQANSSHFESFRVPKFGRR
jgi:hypothetical protein